MRNGTIKSPKPQVFSPETSVRTGYFWNHPVVILYEDRDLMVFDKPAGVLTIANPKEPDKNFVDLVNHQFAKAKGGKLFPCHRLDRETSGAIIFAKTLEGQHRVMDMFKDHTVTKIYIACVQGHLKQKKGEIKSDVKEDGKFKPAVSRFRVIEERKEFSVVEVQPLSGRTNQIRIHFSQYGFPLVGDRKFFLGKKFSVKFKRTALHASRIEFKNPYSGKVISVRSPLPEDMKKLIASH